MPNLLVLRPADAIETAGSLAGRAQPSQRAEPAGADPPEPADIPYRWAATASPKAPTSSPARPEKPRSSPRVEVGSPCGARPARQGRDRQRVVSVPSTSEIFAGRPVENRKAVIGDAPVKCRHRGRRARNWDAIISGQTFVGMTGFGISGRRQGRLRGAALPQAAADAVKLSAGRKGLVEGQQSAGSGV